MTPTVETVIPQAMATWRRLGVDEDTAAEMAEDLAADLTAAAHDGRDAGAVIGDDVDALATSWAVERGLPPLHWRVKETAVAAAGGAFVPAILALVFCFLSWDHTFDPCASWAEPGGGTPGTCRSTLESPWMWAGWAGWAGCALLAFFMIRRTVSVTLQHHLAPAREATLRALPKALPVIIVAGALVGGGIGLLGEPVLGYFAILALPVALVGMLGTVAAGAALLRHRTCPTKEFPAQQPRPGRRHL
ncbi:hypothetical protein [Streptomyces sp. NPDC048637]|uniref:hypothetical protein n=1 Tax=Streptomyces sp. NPDC048637 TaxID=3155636 RepID=UPI0034253CCA